MSEDKKITRKEFLKGVGTTVAGVAVAGSLGSLLTACAKSEPAAPAAPAASAAPQKPEWPFKYKKLDVEKVKARAFKGYKEKGG